MCLEIRKDQKKMIAKEDIPCVKVLYVGETLMSPYKHTPYELGEEKTAVIANVEVVERLGVGEWCKTFDGVISSEFIGEFEVYRFNSYYISEGLHSCSDMKGANDIIESLKMYYFSVKVFHAIIPKGSEYYEGKFAGYGSYVSSKLIITGEV